jgi:hypothetical protein
VEVEVAGGWRRLHNEKLQNLYASSIIIKVMKSRRMRWAGHIPSTGKVRNSHKILVGKPGRKISVARLRSVWKDNTKMYLRETGWESVD